MYASRLTMILITLSIVSCSVRDYEYYLDKDESHWQVYNVSASIRSDGTCRLAIDGVEAESYSELYWTDPDNSSAVDTILNWTHPEDLGDIVTRTTASGFCTDDDRPPVPDPQKYSAAYPQKFTNYFLRPSMYLRIYAPDNIDSGLLKKGVPLPVWPSDILAPRGNQPGVYFSISSPHAIRLNFSPICSARALESVKGNAKLVSESGGVITLEVTALAYSKKNCF